MLISRVLILLSLLLTFSDASNPEPEHCTTKYGGYSAQYVPHSTLTSIRTCWDTVTKTVGQETHIVTPKPTTKYVTSTEIVKATKSGSVKTVKTTYTSYSTLTQTSSTTVPVPTVTVTPTLIPASDVSWGEYFHNHVLTMDIVAKLHSRTRCIGSERRSTSQVGETRSWLCQAIPDRCGLHDRC